MIQTNKNAYTTSHILEQINDRMYTQLAEANSWPEREKVASHILAARTVEQTWRAMTQEEKQVLVYLLFRIGEDVLTYRQMEQYARDTSPLTAYSGLTGLRRRGIVYTLRRLWGEVAYVIPYDLQKVWRVCIQAEEAKVGSGEETLFASYTHSRIRTSEPIPVLWDVLFTIVHTYRYEPIALTKKGVLPMKTRRLLQALIPYEEELVGAVYPQDSEYTARERFVLTLLLHTGVIQRYETTGGLVYQVEEEAVRRLFAGGRSNVQSRIWQAVVEVIGRLHPLYPGMLERLAAADRIDIHNLYEGEKRLLQAAGISPDQKAWDEFVGQILPLLSALGFGSYCTEGGGMLFIWNSRREEGQDEKEKGSGRMGYVQPTFDVLLLPSAPYEIRWEVGAYAELVDLQEVWTFRFTQQTVRNGVRSQGETPLQELLVRIQGTDIPAHIQAQIERWASGGQIAVFGEVFLLRCPDVAVADWLAGDATLAYAIRERLNACDFLIHEASWPTVRTALEKQGVTIQAAQEEASRLVVSQEVREEGFKVESVFPELADSLPELRDIPVIWYKNWQAYHASTLRNMLSRAEALGVPLRLEAGERELGDARVTEIRNEDGDYRVRLAVSEETITVPLQEIGRISWKLPLL